ncbi:MAG: DUF11 domain-containing protein, partial [bacterium]|nr:DUF11 domain-containing protein [bacterium]
VSVADDGTSGTDLNPADNTASDQTPLDFGGGTGPDLVILKDDGGITVDPGDPITYAISVENVGNQHASGVVVSETVPEDTVFLAGSSDPAWSCLGTTAGSSCSLDLGNVAVGTARPPFDFAVLVDSPVGAGVEQIFNTVSVADDGTSGTDLNPADNTASDQTPLDLGGGTGPDLVILKDDGGITVDPGDPITYAISVENVGNQHATGVVVSETVPEDTVFLAGSSDPAWSCLSTTAGSSCSLDLGSVAVGTARLPFDFAVLVDSPVGAGVEQIFNTVSVADDGTSGTDLNPADNTASDQTPLDLG